MKFAIIGDIHCKDVWKKFIRDKSIDKFIFLGDYVDSYVHTNTEMINNLNDLIEYKKNNDNIILLLGNHDISYYNYPDNRCTGFRPEIQFDITEIFRTNRKLFQVAYQINNYLFTHAGVTTIFFEELIKELNLENNYYDNLDDILNEQFAYNNKLLYNVGKERGGVSFGGIFWSDKSESSKHYLKGYHQFVGHTPVEDFTTISIEESSIIYCDVLGAESKYYELEIYDNLNI